MTSVEVNSPYMSKYTYLPEFDKGEVEEQKPKPGTVPVATVEVLTRYASRQSHSEPHNIVPLTCNSLTDTRRVIRAFVRRENMLRALEMQFSEDSTVDCSMRIFPCSWTFQISR